MFERPADSKPDPKQQRKAHALRDLRLALERYREAHASARQATGADQESMRGALSHAEEALTTSAGRFARLEEEVVRT